MTLIRPEHLAAAVKQVTHLSMADKEAHFDVIYREQPNLLASVLVQQQMGNSLAQMEVLLHLLLVIHLSLREAGVTIKPVSEESQEQHLQRLVARINFAQDLAEPMASRALEQQLNGLPEKWLYTYAINEMVSAGFAELTHENGKYLMLCGLNLVNCVSPL